MNHCHKEEKLAVYSHTSFYSAIHLTFPCLLKHGQVYEENNERGLYEY